jgi:hypothetical protein
MLQGQRPNAAPNLDSVIKQHFSLKSRERHVPEPAPIEQCNRCGSAAYGCRRTVRCNGAATDHRYAPAINRKGVSVLEKRIPGSSTFLAGNGKTARISQPDRDDHRIELGAKQWGVLYGGAVPETDGSEPPDEIDIRAKDSFVEPEVRDQIRHSSEAPTPLKDGDLVAELCENG